MTIVDIMAAVLPEADLEDLPTGFTIVGHVGTCTNFPPFRSWVLLLRKRSSFKSKGPISPLQIPDSRGITGQEPYRPYNYQ